MAHVSLLLKRARAVSHELHVLYQARRRNHAEIAHKLWEMKRLDLHSYLGYRSLAAYAWDHHQVGASQTSELVAIARASEALPNLRAAFDEGRLDWTKAREVAKAATPETEKEWLERAETLTANDLQAARKGRPPSVRRALSFESAEAAEYDQLVAGIKKELGVVSDAGAVLELLRRGASGRGGEAPVQRVVIQECPICREATIESREGSVPVDAARVEQARCAGEVHDLREEPSVVKRSAPTRVRRRVFDRDHRRCRVPGCRALAGLEIHHEDGWRSGHDPTRMLTLCTAHHWARHTGRIGIEGDAPAFRFKLLDGTILQQKLSGESSETVPGREVSCENPDAPSPNADAALRDATLALRNLGLEANEARRQVNVALAQGPDRAWTAGELVQAALRVG